MVVGASGAGKSTLTRALAALRLPGVVCHHFDTIGVPPPEEIAANFGDGAAWQAWALDQWVRRLVRNDDGAALAVLDAQVRPHAALDALRRHGVECGRVVLVDCAYDERNARLRGPRVQPELATPDMDCFAAYMRGQADALGLPVLDTTGRPAAACLDELRHHCEELLAAPATTPPMDGSADDEFLEDFGAALTDEQIQRLLALARAVEDRELRLLLKQYLTLRRATRWLVAEVDGASDLAGLRAGEGVRFARFCAGTETSDGADAHGS